MAWRKFATGNDPEDVAAADAVASPVWLDKDKGLFKAVGQGKVRKPSMLALLNPFGRVWREHAALVKERGVEKHNLKGDGSITGGVLVLRRGDGGVEAAWQERTFGDAPEPADVLRAALAAAEKM